MESNPFEDMFNEIWGNTNPIDEIDKKMKEKDAEIERQKNLILRCPECGCKLRIPR